MNLIYYMLYVICYMLYFNVLISFLTNIRIDMSNMMKIRIDKYVSKINIQISHCQNINNVEYLLYINKCVARVALHLFLPNL